MSHPTPRRSGVGVVLAIGVLAGGLAAAGGLPLPASRLTIVSGRGNVTQAQTVGARGLTSGPSQAQIRAAQVGSGQAVTLAFGGDVHFEGALASRLAANPLTVFNGAKPLYAGADLMMVNLETAITRSGTPEPKQFLFRAPPSALMAVKTAGITLATEANNHGEDYGAGGLADSIAAANQLGFPVIGLGRNVGEAFAPYRATISGQRIAILAATNVLDDNLRDEWTATESHPGLASAYDLDHLLPAIRQARATSDTVVVYLHWGIEGQGCPSPVQEQMAQRLVDAGADVVVGSHTHVQLGAGMLDGAFVDYGLGNFAFYATQPAQLESGVLKVTMTGRRVDGYRWAPAYISGGVASPLKGQASSVAERRWAGLRSCTNLGAGSAA